MRKGRDREAKRKWEVGKVFCPRLLSIVLNRPLPGANMKSGRERERERERERDREDRGEGEVDNRELAVAGGLLRAKQGRIGPKP